MHMWNPTRSRGSRLDRNTYHGSADDEDGIVFDLLQGGRVPLPVVARLLGHAQVQMTLRYPGPSRMPTCGTVRPPGVS